MKVTRDVISDLLPLVEAGEASPDSRALVEEYLREHPDEAPAAEDRARRVAHPEAEPLPPELEMRTLKRTKRLFALRSWLTGLGIFLVLLPGASYHTTRTVNGREVFRMEWLMARDNPPLAAASAALGICCWAGWFALRRRLRATAL